MTGLLATTAATAEAPVPGRPTDRVRAGLRRTGMALLGVVVLLALWELYRAVGPVQGVEVGGQRVLPRADPRSMPGVLDVLATLDQQEVSVPGSRTVAVAVVASAWRTFTMAVGGWLLGGLVGVVLAVLMQRSRLAERGLLPYVVLSQTVPIIAIAPLIAGWGGKLQLTPTLAWQPWMSVVVISGYLAFCPVALGMLRGLQAPTSASEELFTSFAATHRQTLLRLRFPASVPHLVPALRLAAAQAVVGAIVAEISTGTRGGIGRLILQYAQQATSAPGRLYAAILGAALLGLLAAGLVSLLDLLLLRHGGKR
ncbi:ABC transporter permease [Kineococcus sp. GCM10028916]|uniref:ABC transporter permease n=1 Tax=Kineococcus sp. GCM10028916 TaxID=3273394 RepID=UPI00363C4CF9